jgi:hypothetical protein
MFAHVTMTPYNKVKQVHSSIALREDHHTSALPPRETVIIGAVEPA